MCQTSIKDGLSAGRVREWKRIHELLYRPTSPPFLHPLTPPTLVLLRPRPSARGTLKPSSPSRPTSRRAALYDSPPVRGTLNPYPSPARSAWRRAAPDDMPGGGALNDVTLQQRTLKSRLNSAILKLSEEEALRKLENKSVSDTHGL